MIRRSLWTVLLLVASHGCAQPESGRRTVASYDPFSSRLQALAADQNGDGQLDQWTYLDGNRLLRGEADQDGDGRIDRWEYFDREARLTEVGSSSANDGVEDTWTWVQPIDGEGRVDRARHRDRWIDRREYFRGGQLTRAEEDTNGDGRTDRWDVYDATVLRMVSFDTSLKGQAADRRVTYDAGGRFVAVEIDPERDGTFVRVTGAADPVAGAKR
jgi:hypothetical protein